MGKESRMLSPLDEAENEWGLGFDLEWSGVLAAHDARGIR
jgi:hypothetical protein